MQVFDISKRFEQFTNTAREVQFDLNFGLLLLVKCSSLSKPLSCCSESAIRFGFWFLTARKVHFTVENHFLAARKVKFGSDGGFLLLRE